MIQRLLKVSVAVIALTGCESAIRGAPEVTLDTQTGLTDRQPLSQYVFESRLTKKSVNSALSDQDKPGVGRARRNQLVFARIAEIDLLYNSYETAVLTDARKAGFGLSFASAIAGLLGGFTNGETSQIFSLIGGGFGAAQTSFDKEILAESTIQAFVSQMRAARASVRSEIYSKLIASATMYPIEAALIDLQDYTQAGTLASAIAGISESASTAAREKESEVTKSEGLLFNHSISADPATRDVVERLLKFAAESGANATAYLAAAKAEGIKLIPASSPQNARAVEAISNPANAAANLRILKTLKL